MASNNNRLYRNFVILQEDERGYSNANDKALSGYSKIEAKGDKCKISFYAQNLRKDSDKYYMMVICSKKDLKQIINLGPIEVSEGGKAEATREYNVSNIGGLDLQFDKISGTAIGRIIEGVPVFVMCGFLNGQQPAENWRSFTVVKANEIKGKYIEKEHKKEPRRPEVKREEKVISTEVVEEVKVVKAEVIEEKVKKTSATEDKVGRDSKHSEDKKYEKKENLRGKFDDYEDELESKKEFDPVDGKIRGSIGEYFEGIVNGFDRDYASISELKYTKWYKVKVTDLHEMCNMSNYNKYTLAYYPMLNYYPYIKRYGYFMLGYKCDSKGNLKHIIYGVPGKKEKDDQPYDGRTGFVTWVPVNSEDENGCWLMFYDFKNSTVVVPMQ